MSLIWNHVAYTALGVLNIPLVAGNDVDMDVEYALSGRWSNINADIVAIRAELFIKEIFFLDNQIHTGSHFFRRQLEKAGDMPSGNDDAVTRARRVGITGTVSEVITQGHPFGVRTKQAGIIGISLFFLFFFRHRA